MADTDQVATQEPKIATQPRTAPKPRVGELPPYHVVLLDDDQHTYEYVIDMLKALFAHSEPQAFLLAKQVDSAGRAIVCTTHKERAELKRDQILAFGSDARIASSRQSMNAVIKPAEV